MQIFIHEIVRVYREKTKPASFPISTLGWFIKIKYINDFSVTLGGRDVQGRVQYLHITLPGPQPYDIGAAPIFKGGCGKKKKKKKV